MKIATVALISILGSVATYAGSVQGEDAKSLIERLENETNNAYAANNLSKYFDAYADDAILVFYDKRTTVSEYRKMWTEATKSEPIESVKLSDMVVRVLPSSSEAIASYQIDVRTRHPNGPPTDEHGFETDVWSKVKGSWKLVLVHYSVMPGA